MSRFKLLIEYEGTRYSGWQMQKGGKSIQGEIIDACRDLFESPADVFGAGRTDAGVHALGQVAHLEVQTDLPALRIRYGLNDRLPPDISIIDVAPAEADFHARHFAIARSYLYQISRRRTALGKKFVWWIKDPLSVEKMNEAAKKFVGLKDFRNFTDKDQEQGSTKAEVLHSEVSEAGELILFNITGSHFLWKQVRRITGILVEVGRGTLSPADIPSFFHGQTDMPAKHTAPPSGLFLEKVWYPGEKLSFVSKPVIRI